MLQTWENSNFVYDIYEFDDCIFKDANRPKSTKFKLTVFKTTNPRFTERGEVLLHIDFM